MAIVTLTSQERLTNQQQAAEDLYEPSVRRETIHLITKIINNVVSFFQTRDIDRNYETGARNFAQCLT
jgi:hypothetical protein